MTVVPITNARDHLADLGTKAALLGDRVIVERRNKPLFAIVSIEDLELLRRLEDREDLDLIRSRLKESAEPWEKVKAELGL